MCSPSNCICGETEGTENEDSSDLCGASSREKPGALCSLQTAEDSDAQVNYIQYKEMTLQSNAGVWGARSLHFEWLSNPQWQFWEAVVWISFREGQEL